MIVPMTPMTMNPKAISYVVLLGLALSAATFAADDRPNPALTEQWEPVPPVISAPADGVPSDAIVLFDGTSLDAWRPARPDAPGWKLEDGIMQVVPQDQPCDMLTKQAFGDVQLHLEFRTPPVVKGSGQNRGNSGVFLMGLYEIQVLDSWENSTYVNGQLGAIYKQYPPLVNPARPPGEWQVYDVVFIAPRFDADDNLVSPARMTAFLNGVLVQYDSALVGPTPNGPTYNMSTLPPYQAHAAKLPLMLQDHRDLVAYRNIWVRELPALPSPP